MKYIYILQERKIRVFRRTEGIQIVVVVSLWVDQTVSQFVGVDYLNSVLIGLVRQLLARIIPWGDALSY